ncbi:MAG: hypothetical protein ABIR19_02795 [Ginsengibacter sp.]
MKKISKLAMASAISAVLVFSSCKKDDSIKDPGNSGQAATINEATQNDAEAEAQYNELFNITMGVQSADAGEDVGIGSGADIIYTGRTNVNGNYLIETPDSARCFTVTANPQALHSFPKTIILDFGTGCVGKDGKTRKGKITSVYTGPMFIPGNKVTTTLTGYEVDSFKIEGKQVIENTSSSNSFAWKTDVIHGKITNTVKGFWKMWVSSKTHTRSEGNGTPFYPRDDVFQITGDAHGSSSNNNSWTAEITDPLIKKNGCRWLSKGVVSISINNNKGLLDYGSGDCDNNATITVNGVSHDIILHK